VSEPHGLPDWPDANSIRRAAERIAPHVCQTPLANFPTLDRLLGVSTLLKCENQQEGGAFKARGACHAVFSLTEAQARRGVATHSSGNHAAALARAAHRRGISAHVVMPEGAARPKREATLAWGARVIDCPPSMEGRVQALDAVVRETGATVVHPYEDYAVMAGQGTVALELSDQLMAGDTLLVPVGGGGLASGMACFLAESWPDIRIIGVEPSGADDALRSFRAGSVVPVQADTVADGLRATVGGTNLAILRHFLTDIVTVSDEEIIHAMSVIWQHTAMRLEPSGAVCVAALLSGRLALPGRAVCVLTGGNVEAERFAIW